jgi:hypothetical protein
MKAMGKLFIENMKLYIYPTVSSVSIDDPTRGQYLLTSENLPLPEDLKDLYNYLIKNLNIIYIKIFKNNDCI